MKATNPGLPLPRARDEDSIRQDHLHGNASHGHTSSSNTSGHQPTTSRLTPEQVKALDIARKLVAAGIPVFAALPDPHGVTKSGKATGFQLPDKWERTRANTHHIDHWQPGMALCAVGGVAADFADTDVQNDGDLAHAKLVREGIWPDSYGRARTPSGGTHDVIARLHVGKRARDGIDYQGGDDDGNGRGFVFIAPTVKPSKLTGEMVPYTWEVEPDIPALKTKGLTDRTGEKFATWVHEKTRKPKASDSPFANPGEPGEYRVADDQETIPSREGHIQITSYIGKLLAKYPDIELDKYVDCCRQRWQQYEPGPTVWPWEDCYQNPVLDCWERFERGEVRDEETPEEPQQDETRWVNLDEFLDGTYEAPRADLGACRDDGWQFLYPGRWHTLVGLTTAGKTFWALWQAKAVMEAGGHAMYIHFEEGSPAGTLARLTGMGVDKEVLRKQFHWGHTHKQWTNGEMAREVAKLSDVPALAVLDGINAACGMHDWNVSEDPSVGKYQATFVKPLLALEIAVLSLGHPVKNVNRQDEAYSYGAAGWLNNPDGCALRMETAKEWPIGKGKEGGSELFVVKDRYADVQQHGNLEPDRGNMPWYYMGRFIVNDTVTPQKLRVSTPALPETGGAAPDKFDGKADRVLEFLQSKPERARFANASRLLEELQGAGYWTGTKGDLAPTLLRLVNRGVLEWPKLPEDAPRGTPRPGWLTSRYTFDPEAGTE
jgi:hypothetical protein